jgi:GntR family transcriptional regulator
MQIVQQVEQAISLGYIGEGDILPKIKDVVLSLGINNNTVLKAYRSLEEKGLTRGVPGLGTLVVASGKTKELARTGPLVRTLRKGWLAEALASGMSPEAIAALFQSTLREEVIFRDQQRKGRRRSAGA